MNGNVMPNTPTVTPTTYMLMVILSVICDGIITYFLWNWLVPSIFHLPQITCFQAVGLLMLVTHFSPRANPAMQRYILRMLAIFNM